MHSDDIPGTPLLRRRVLGTAAVTLAGLVATPAVADASPGRSRNALHRLADRYVCLANAHDLEGLVALHDPSYISHEPNGTVANLEVYRARTKGFFDGFPDGQIHPINVVAEGDLMVMNFLATGTNTAPFMGRPPTGKSVEFAEVRVRRIARGKIVEQWGLLDMTTLLAQLQG